VKKWKYVFGFKKMAQKKKTIAKRAALIGSQLPTEV
jgi:hypothetical protein